MTARARRGRSSRAAIAVAAALLAACCGEDVMKAPSSSPSLRLPSGLQLQVEVDPAMVPRGESTRITVRLRNPTASPVTLEFPSSCQFLFEVLDAGYVVAPEPVACATVITALTVSPGGSREGSFRWDGQAGTGTRLARGKYGVVGILPTSSQSYRTQAAPIWLD